LVERKAPARRFTPRVVINIRNALASNFPTGLITAEDLYEAVLSIFYRFGREKEEKPGNEGESWLNLIPADLR
jgi:hypothetical protein